MKADIMWHCHLNVNVLLDSVTFFKTIFAVCIVHCALGSVLIRCFVRGCLD